MGQTRVLHRAMFVFNVVKCSVWTVNYLLCPEMPRLSPAVGLMTCGGQRKAALKADSSAGVKKRAMGLFSFQHFPQLQRVNYRWGCASSPQAAAAFVCQQSLPTSNQTLQGEEEHLTKTKVLHLWMRTLLYVEWSLNIRCLSFFWTDCCWSTEVQNW